VPLTSGTRLGPYEILHPIGAGAMGEVHRARHLKLRRDVAIKILPPDLAGDPWRLARFEREARTASALNHPNIVVIHDIAEHEGTTYIAMELVEGRTLRDLIAEGPLPIDRAIRLASQIADGLARAHAAGIVHRDIKPANVMVTEDELVKILDFGLAKPLTTADRQEITRATLESREGMIVGTPLYMSPEQVSGDRVDHHSDQFALGVVLYEMLGGRPPFEGPSLVRAILAESPLALRRLRPDTPADLERIIGRCLEKEAGKRFPSTTDLASELRRLYESRRAYATHGLVASLKRPRVVATLAAIAVGLGAAGVLWARGSGERWARGEAVAQIASLTEKGDLYEAYRTARRAQRYRAGDPELERLLNRITLPISVNTEPAGAEVSVKGYATPDAPWEPIGATPIATRIPYAMMRWKITKPGYEPFEGAPFSGDALGVLMQGLVLDSAGTRPPGTVRIPAGTLDALPGARPPDELPAVDVELFFLDRYEVTNRQFKTFVDAGGYQQREYWRTPNEGRGQQIAWEAAIDSFRDATGRPGPSTWEAGTYPAGEDDHPVGGVSWYEAAAYCAFAGKSLPTIYHWFHAIGQKQISDILVHSNFDGDGTAQVGRFKGLGGYGTYDMAGNVKEWAWNASDDKRYILGGAWNEPGYVFEHLIRADPLERASTHGVRCAQYPTPPAEQLLASVTPRHEYDRPAPITDDAFAVLRGMYAYDRTSLDAEVVRVNDSLPNYRRETVSIRTAYGNQRMTVHLLIPRDVSPPYQSVIWFPGDDVFFLQSSESFASEYLFDFIPRGGRVLVYPIYKGMYERFEPPDFSPSGWRDMVIRWSQDLSRTIDYLETRRDFDAQRIAYYGFSSGALYGPVFTAVDPRIGAAIYLGGGLIPVPLRPEMHPVHFAPRSRTPTLMINGRDDFIVPYELSQQPLLAMLGAPEDKKRLARLAGGHIPTNRLDIIREVLDWLDQHLGPVQPATSVVER
jgi:formylglycine-generating enzyme required for sulfatase activity/predicted esterase